MALKNTKMFYGDEMLLCTILMKHASPRRYVLSLNSQVCCLETLFNPLVTDFPTLHHLDESIITFRGIRSIFIFFHFS